MDNLEATRELPSLNRSKRGLAQVVENAAPMRLATRGWWNGPRAGRSLVTGCGGCGPGSRVAHIPGKGEKARTSAGWEPAEARRPVPLRRGLDALNGKPQQSGSGHGRFIPADPVSRGRLTMHTAGEERFLREAIQLSIDKMQAGEGGPFGAIVVRDGQIVGRGWNRVTSANDPTAHAEIVAIRAACRTLNTFRLKGCLLYSSCEPCPMCLAAIYWARIDSLWYAAGRDDAARAGFDDAWIAEQIGRPPQEQSLSIRQALRDEALVAFDVWLRNENRVEY